MHGYNEKNVFSLLGIADIDRLLVKYLPIYLEVRLASETPLALIIKLFLLSQKISIEKFTEIFDGKILATLKKAGLLCVEGDWVYPAADVYPCRGGFFATDHLFSSLYVSKHVYPLGRDSYCLARGMIKDPVNNTLDLCTGSGVQGILASKFSKKVVCVDLNPRAVNFARFNALLNQAGNVEVRQGDLYSAVPSEKFDRIFANPPFVPSPENRIRYRDGSPTGESILKRIIEGLPAHLNEGGISQIVTLLVFTGEDYNKKVRSWLGTYDADILTLANRYMEVEPYIMTHMDYDKDFEDYSKKLLSWLNSYRKAGITKLADGLINIKSNENNLNADMFFNFNILTDDFSRKIKTTFNTSDFLRSADALQLVMQSNFTLSDEVDFFWEGTGKSREKKAGVLFKIDSFFTEKQITETQKKILEIIVSGISRGENILKELNMQVGQVEQGVFFKEIGALVSDGIVSRIM